MLQMQNQEREVFRMKKNFTYICEHERIGSKKKLTHNHCILCLFRVIAERLEADKNYELGDSDE